MDYKKYDTEDFIMDPDFRDWVLTPSKESNIYWKNFLEDHPDKRNKIKDARGILMSMARIDHSNSARNHKNALWDKIEGSLGEAKDARKTIPLNATSVLGAEKKESHDSSLIIRILVAAMVIMAFGLFIYLDKDDTSVLAEDGFTTIIKSNPSGQKSTILLPDGSKVILNAGSSLEYPSVFSDAERRILLSGEAFFDVIEDKSSPFLVQTGHLITTALGTSFNVRAYYDHEEVTLVSGKVSVSNKSDDTESVILAPNEKVTFEDHLNPIGKASPADISWKDGVIYFQKTPWDAGIEELERWYGVDIEVVNLGSKKGMELTGTFDNDNLHNVLTSLGFSMKFEHKIDQKNVKIIFK